MLFVRLRRLARVWDYLLGNAPAPTRLRPSRLRVEGLEDRTVPSAPPAGTTVTVEKISDAAEGGADGVFRFTRTGDTSDSLIVNVAIGGTATSGVDYTSLGETVTVAFEPGSATADLLVDVIDDAVPESDEGVTASVLEGTGYQVGSPSGAVVVISDNETPVVSVSRVSDATEGYELGFFSLARTGDTTSALTVNVSVSGTATSGTDYTAIGTTVVFAAGEDTAMVELEATADSTYDPAETFILTVDTGTGYNVGTLDEATILIHDAVPLIDVHRVTDATEDGTVGYFRFSRSGDLSSPLTIGYTVGGSATSKTDFTALDGSVTFEEGESEVYVPVEPLDDTTSDPGETVTVTISTGSGHVVGTSPASLMIVDDETPTATVTRTADAAEGGADGNFRFTRTGDTTNSLTVSYTLSGTAVNGTDFTSLSGSITFAAGKQSADLAVEATDDTSDEGPETIFATVTSGSTYGAAPNAVALMNLSDDDGTDGRIGGVLWLDANEDGVRQTTEDLLSGHAVELLNEAGEHLLDAVTDANGEYEFIGLAEGTYYTKVLAPLLHWYAEPDQGSDEANDSDTDPDTGLSGPIALTALALTNLTVGAGFTAVHPPVANPTETTIAFTTGYSKPVTTENTLRVAKWSNAFEEIPPPPGQPREVVLPVRIKPPGANQFDFIDRDPDRFNVWVYDIGKWKGEVDGAPSDPYITITISTTHTDANFKAYDDDATTIALTRIKNMEGWYWSDSQMLVSNKADDEHSDANVGKDEVNVGVPGKGDTPRKNKDQDTNGGFIVADRTHRIALGGTVKATYGAKSETAQVKIEKKVTVNGYILGDAQGDPLIGEQYLDTNSDGKWIAGEQWRDDDGNKAYTPQLSKELALARFTNDLVVANESYAQVGVRIVAGVSKVITAPAAIANGEVRVSSMSPGKESELTATEKAIVQGKFNTADKDDIEVYYVANVITDNGRERQSGWAFAADYYENMTTPDVNDSILMSNGAKYYTLGHELYHIFSKSPKHASIAQSLMRLPSSPILRESDARVTDTKRLTVDEHGTIRDSKYAKNPT